MNGTPQCASSPEVLFEEASQIGTEKHPGIWGCHWAHFAAGYQLERMLAISGN
jgi:hypothetical protein